MTHPIQTRIQSWLRLFKRAAAAAVLAGGTVAGATNFDLSLSKTASATSLSAGQSVTFSLQVRNAGPYAATNVVINDMLPKGFKYVSANFTPSKVDSTSDPKIVQYYFNLGTISAGSSKTVTIQATGVAPANIVAPSIDDHYNYKNIAEVHSVDYSSYDPDSRPNNCDYGTIAAGYSLQDDCGWVRVPVTGTVTPPPPTTTCNSMYALGVDSSGNGRYIRPLSDTNVVGSTIATLPNSGTSATLAISPDGTRFYTASDDEYLRIYNPSTKTWSTGGYFQSVSGRLVRMAITPSGTGYAMDSTGNFYSFTLSGAVTRLGTLTSTSSGAPGFYDNGDFIATADGKLYLLSAQASGAVSLWFVDPVTRKAEFLGNLSNSTGVSQYGGLAATLSGIYASTSSGVLSRVDIPSVSLTKIGTNSGSGSTDLTSCYYPAFRVTIEADKTVKKVAGSTGTDVQPGDTLEYTIVVRNSGTLPAGAVTFQDALPAGTTYVAGSASVNGFSTTVTNGSATYLGGTAYPFTNPVGICSADGAACDTQVLKADSTPNTLDNEAVIKFRVKVNDPFTLSSMRVSNQGFVRYNDGNTTPTPIPTDDPSTTTPNDPTTVPVVPNTKPSLTITKASNAASWIVGQSGANYTLTVKNTGTAPTSGLITVKDLLPTGITPTSSTFSTNGWSCTASSQTLTCTSSASLAVGASSTLTIPVNVADSAVGTVTNRASVGGGGDPDPQPDPGTCTTTGGQCATASTTVEPKAPTPTPGTCSATTPYVQSFNTSGPLGEVKNHSYKADPNVVTATDGTYTLWNGIDNTGNGGYALYMNIANFEGKNGGALTNPGLLYESYINVPAGSTVTYQNYVRSHSSTATQLRYVLTDAAGGAVLQTYDGAVATTSYTLQTVPSFTATGPQIIVRIYTLRDGTSADTNVLKLDDIKVTCPTPVKPSLTITKTSNGPWQYNQSGATYTLTVKNTSTTSTSGLITVKDLLPAGITPTSNAFSTNGWSCTASSQTLTCTSSAVISGGASSTLTIPVNVTEAAASTVVNRASVAGGGDPDPQPDPGTCTTTGGQCATHTTTITYTPTPTTCTSMYALVVNPSASNLDGRTIRLLNENNTLGSTIATIPNNGVSATLAVSPDGTRFYTAVDYDRLRIYNTVTGTWSAGQTFSGLSGRLVRMAITKDGIGYAMDSSGNFWSFTLDGLVTPLGKLTSTSSGAPSFFDNGDFFATADGKLYMISSVTGGTSIDLWLVTPSTLSAEYLGRLSNPANSSQWNGIAATPTGIYAADNLGRLVKIDLVNLTYNEINPPTTGSTDLTSCYYPVYAPNITAVKTVKKVGGSGGTAVQPGDLLEYTIVVRNDGTLPAGGLTFTDLLPAGTTYVADSARINGATTTVLNGAPISLSGPTYPFASPVGICSLSGAPCTTQVLKIDDTPGVLDDEAVITFRVKVNSPFTLDPAKVVNQALINYTGGPTGGVPSNPVETPVFQPTKLLPTKTVQNITANGPVGTTGTGNPGDVLEYCVATKNVGGLSASKIIFGDTVPSNTTFLVGGYAPGQDIKVTLPNGDVLYYTAATGDDAGELLAGRVIVNGGTGFVLQPNQTVTVCFRATIQ